LRWEWDAKKNAANKRKHGLSFEVAQLVFADPLLGSRPDKYLYEERWQTIGLINNGLVVFVVHTAPKRHPWTGEEIGRIISARKATNYERRAYEEGYF